MLPYCRILCPTDFSAASFAAVEAAAELALHFDAELVLLHVATPIPLLPDRVSKDAFDVDTYHQELIASGMAQLQEVADARIPDGVRLRPMVRTGDAPAEIVSTAADEQADLIAIATHGLTGWRRFITGSVTEKVVRLAHCPVLAICPRQGSTDSGQAAGG